MAGGTGLAGLSDGARKGLIAGAVIAMLAFGNGHWFWGIVVGGAVVAVAVHLLNRGNAALTPWPWPADFRADAEALARPIDPTPKRVLPRDPNTLPPGAKDIPIAGVVTTKAELARLIAERTHSWPWAVFASVLVQRRNAVQARLRTVASGYQPRPGLPLSGQAYTHVAQQSVGRIADLVGQIEQFMLSPAFKGSFGDYGDDSNADPDAVVSIANRLMDYHESLLTEAETCLQTPVESDVLVFVQDTGAVALCPLIGYDDFIRTMCERVAEAQDLLPFTKGGTVVALDDAQFTMIMPDGLAERIPLHAKRFSD